jgi:phosphohistidine swiveling domain-containing protein
LGQSSFVVYPSCDNIKEDMIYLFSETALPTLAVFGGMFQCAAVVAREYSQPCVAGIRDNATCIQEGQVIDADGTTAITQVGRRSRRIFVTTAGQDAVPPFGGDSH